MRSVLGILFLLVAVRVVHLEAVVRRVPQEYPTIQSALDAGEDADTILIGVGVYHEALIVPARGSIVIRGDVAADTGDYPRPVIDPSPLPRPDTVTCLQTSDSSGWIVIEDITFRNGREMYDSIPRRIGGISDHSDRLTLKRCTFDSTYAGVSAGDTLCLEDCEFRMNRVICARTDRGPLLAANTIFSCDGGGGQNVSARSHSLFQRCRFRDNRSGHLLVTLGDSIVVEDCIFGPFGPQTFNAVEFWAGGDCALRRNLFVDCGVGQTVVNVAVDCRLHHPLPAIIEDNVFMNYYGGQTYGGAAIKVYCFYGQQPSFMGRISDNVFEDGIASLEFAEASGITAAGTIEIERNRFTRLDPPNVPDVHAFRVDNGVPDTLYLRDNLFDSSGIAATVDLARIDARWNWWGDSTGPYNQSLNPDGQGGFVGDNVLFEPWYTDTTFETDEQRPPIVPNAFSLSAYPNPFNSQVEFRLTVPRAGAYDITLFDILGRQAASVWHGRTEREQRVSFDASALSSGIYFAHLRGRDSETGATTKILLLK